MTKIILVNLLFITMFILNGCQGTNSESSVPTSTTLDDGIPRIVLHDTNIVIRSGGEVVNIEINVYDVDNSPYPDGNIKIKYPDAVLSGRDIGSFDTSVAPVVNGKASFVYTAPSILDGNNSLVFGFYHDLEPLLSIKNTTINIIPNPNEIILNNYSSTSVYESTMPLESVKEIRYYISDKSGNNVVDSDMTSVTIRLLNPALGSLEDTSGNTGSSITVNNKNNVQMNIKSKTISGVIPVEISAEFKDANNNKQTLTEVFNIVVLSGPPTAMSLSYAGTEHTDAMKERAKFVENWVLTVTDKYNNLVNSNPAISMGMISGYTKIVATDFNTSNYLYSNPSPNNILKNANPYDKFSISDSLFDNVDLVNDTLVLFGDGYTYNASGKWDIQDKSSNTLDLKDDYAGLDTSGLGFAVGHNYRQGTCEGGEYVVNVYPQDNNYTLGDTGSMIIKTEYDYYLVGKSVMLWVNLIGEHNNTTVKVGEAKKITLRGLGLESESYTIPIGFQGIMRLPISITETVEWYKNANFSYQVEIGDVNWSKAGSSMEDGISSCINQGVAYVDILITDPTTSASSVQLINILSVSEF